MLLDKGDILKIIREYYKLSQTEFADKLGYKNKSYISQRENGVDISKPMYYSICYAFDLPFEIFENDEITKKEIINILNDTNVTKFIHKRNYRIDFICGLWYSYRFANHPEVYGEYVDETININFNQSKGYLLNRYFRDSPFEKIKDTLTLSSKDSIMIFNDKQKDITSRLSIYMKIVERTPSFFYAIITSIDINHQIYSDQILFSKNKLELDEIKKLLPDNKKITIDLSYKKIIKEFNCS